MTKKFLAFLFLKFYFLTNNLKRKPFRYRWIWCNLEFYSFSLCSYHMNWIFNAVPLRQWYYYNSTVPSQTLDISNVLHTKPHPYLSCYVLCRMSPRYDWPANISYVLHAIKLDLFDLCVSSHSPLAFGCGNHTCECYHCHYFFIFRVKTVIFSPAGKLNHSFIQFVDEIDSSCLFTTRKSFWWWEGGRDFFL